MAQIIDPRTGYSVKVDRYGRLVSVSSIRSEVEYFSEVNEDSYTITTENYTFNSTNEHPWLYVENKEKQYDMFFDSIIYSYNGGDTNHNRTLIKKLYRNPPQPTANMTELTPKNLNFGSVRKSDTLVYSWDGSATDGMEVDLVEEQSTLTSTVQAGTLVLSDVKGMILPFGTSVLISFKPEEIGMASISLKIFFKDRS